jgi:sulfate transport system substrate-binding protein
MTSLRQALPLASFLLSSTVLSAGPAQNPGAETPAQGQAQEILNVSYDPTRELFAAINLKFEAIWEKSHPVDLSIKQSHGGSGKQAQAVVDGLKADVVTLALAPDVNLLVEKGLVKEGWQQNLPFNSAPYTSTIVYVVRTGNPKAIKDWVDLTRSDVGIVTPNPKLSGGARWSYLAAWGYALQGDQQNQGIAAFDSGARGATLSFAEKGLGDVLITWENEAHQILKSYPDQKFEIVLPSVSILAEPVAAVVDSVVDARGTRDVATAYLNYLYSDEAQEIIAQNFYRPRNAEILAKHQDVLSPITLFSVEERFVSWDAAQDLHFGPGGKLDQVLSAVGLQ